MRRMGLAAAVAAMTVLTGCSNGDNTDASPSGEVSESTVEEPVESEEAPELPVSESEALIAEYAPGEYPVSEACRVFKTGRGPAPKLSITIGLLLEDAELGALFTQFGSAGQRARADGDGTLDGMEAFLEASQDEIDAAAAIDETC